MTRAFLFISLLFMLVTSCNIVKYASDKLPEKQLIFGEGGGFSGAVQEFIILENGQVFSRTSFTETPTEMKGIGKAKAKKLFKKAELLNIAKRDFIEPGDIYFFVQIQNDAKSNHRVVWGDANHKVPEDIEAFYQELKKLPKPLKKK